MADPILLIQPNLGDMINLKSNPKPSKSVSFFPLT